MTREQYDELSAPLVRVLLDMEDDILREIAAQLSRDGDISDTSKWRIRQLARAGRFDKRAAAIIAGYSEVEGGQAMDAVLTMRCRRRMLRGCRNISRTFLRKPQP